MDYRRLQTTYSTPDRAMPAAARAATLTQGIRGYVAAGHHGNTGIGGRSKRQGRAVHNLDKLAVHGAAAQA